MLVHFSESQDEEAVNTNIVVVAALSEDKKCELHEANRLVNGALSQLQIIDAVHSNMEELFETVIYNIIPQSADTVFNAKLQNLPREIARRLLNLCASFNSMIRHHDTLLVRQFGRSSAEVLEWREFKNELLKSRFEYALMYGLRNYIEHVDMPSVSCNVHQEEDGTVEIDITLLRDAFLADEVRLGADIARQFREQPEEIPLWPLLQNWHEFVFREIAGHVLGARVGDVRRSATTISRLRENYGIGDSGKIGFWFAPFSEENPRNSKFRIALVSDCDAQRLCKLMHWI